MDCIFCKIVDGDIPSDKVMETENLIVIKDVNPQAPTHLLIIPKKHYDSLNECDGKEIMSELLETAKETAAIMGVKENGYRLTINTGKGGGQSVFHLHMHLMGGKTMSEKMT